MPIGSVGGNAETVAAYRAAGYDFVAMASDLGLLMRGLQGALQSMRQGAPAPASKAPEGY
jgi:2-keto-3-deoxy-L-rhamnonate aldolase RhmA